MQAIGFGRGLKVGEDDAAIRKLFTPEFRNRLDAIIPFAPLGQQVVRRVVDKFVLQLEAQLSDRNVTISLTEQAADWLVEKGYSPEFGARPLARVIQENIKKPLADELLFGRLAKGGHVKIIVVDDKIDFDLTPSDTPPKKPDKSKRTDGAGDGGKVPETVR